MCDHLPHGWEQYEGKTFCKINGQFQEIKLQDMFPTTAQQEFLRAYCENSLKMQDASYFSGNNPLRTRLEQEEICNFIIDDKSLIIFFQPYTVGGLGDGPPHVRIFHEHLKSQWKTSHPLPLLLHQTISSKTFTAPWDE